MKQHIGGLPRLLGASVIPRAWLRHYLLFELSCNSPSLLHAEAKPTVCGPPHGKRWGVSQVFLRLIGLFVLAVAVSGCSDVATKRDESLKKENALLAARLKELEKRDADPRVPPPLPQPKPVSKPPQFNPAGFQETVRWAAEVVHPIEVARKAENQIQLARAQEDVTQILQAFVGTQISWEMSVAFVSEEVVTVKPDRYDGPLFVAFLAQEEKARLRIGRQIDRDLAATLGKGDLLVVDGRIERASVAGRVHIALADVTARLSLNGTYAAARGQEPFHLRTCEWVRMINPELLSIDPLYRENYGTRDQAIAAGHRPCKQCNP